MSKRKNKARHPQGAAAAAGPATGELQTHNRHLMIVAISPVQPFIGAARRMRDLAFGSHLLSNLAGDLAACLQQQHQAQLIFPSAPPPGGGDLSGAARSTNKIVCLLPRQQRPAEVAAALHAALRTLLDALAARCLKALGKDDAGVDAGAVRAQMQTALQLFHGWSLVGSDDGKAYDAAYQRAQAMLDARKGLRNLMPPPAQPGRQLSSLDGARDSVLADGQRPPGHLVRRDDGRQQAAGRLRKRFQIDAGEQLDAIGLAKRVLGTDQGFPALVRVALQPWVAQWQRDARERPGTVAGQRLEKLHAVLDSLCGLGEVRRNRVPAGHPAAVLPFDGDLLLQPRRRLALLQARKNGTPHAVLQQLGKLEALLHDEPALRSEEALSVAVLVADGDHLGSVILPGTSDQRPPGALHRRLASELAAFADAATAIVQDHGGCGLYAGGDDLLAVLPVQTALACAEALRLAYAQRLAAVLPETLQPKATLSIGVAIGHISAPMGRLMDRARDACRAAKDGPDGHGLRNALGLAVQPRAGARVQTVQRWAPDPAKPDAHAVAWLQRWVTAFADGTVSGSLPYDLVRLADDEPGVALVAASARLFARRGITRDDLQQDIATHWQQAGLPDLPAAPAARRLADALYLCRWLASHPQPARPEQAGTPDARHDAP